MPHWNAAGQEEWVCQKGAHVCTGKSIWVERDSDLGKKLDCQGNVCPACMQKVGEDLVDVNPPNWMPEDRKW